MCVYYPTPKKAMEKNLAAERDNREVKKKSKEILNMIQYMSDYLPSGYQKWEAEQFQTIMFYRKEGKKKYKGYCECGAVVDLTSARSARIIQCPECKKQVRLTNTKYNVLGESNYFAFLQPAEGGWIQRLFVTSKYSRLDRDSNKVQTEIGRIEEERDYFNGESIRYFHPVYGGYGIWKQGPGRKHGMSWTSWRVCEKPLHTFPKNLSALFHGTEFEYSALEIAAEHALVNPFYYLWEYKKEPRLEMIFKLGLYRVGQQMLNPGLDSHEIKRLMRDVKTLKDLGITSKGELAECRNMTVQQLIARKEVKEWRLSPEQRETAIEFIKEVNSRSIERMNLFFMTRREWFKYYLSQKEKYGIPDFLSDYIDYIKDCTVLRYNLSDPQVIMPKDLSAAHERSIVVHKYMTAEQNRKAYCTQVQKWLKKGYTDSVFEITVIPTPDDLVREAQAMRNCSAGYVGRIAEGLCSIWKIRRCDAPDQAFYMLELSSDGRVVQCRGVANSSGYCGQPPATPEVQAFVDKWRLKKILPVLAKNQQTAM